MGTGCGNVQPCPGNSQMGSPTGAAQSWLCRQHPLRFSSPFSSNSSLLALPVSDAPAGIQPLPSKGFLGDLSPAAHTGTTGGCGHRLKVPAPNEVFEPDKGALGGPWSKADQIRGASEPSWPQPRPARGQRRDTSRSRARCGSARPGSCGWAGTEPGLAVPAGQGRDGHGSRSCPVSPVSPCPLRPRVPRVPRTVPALGGASCEQPPRLEILSWVWAKSWENFPEMKCGSSVPRTRGGAGEGGLEPP